MILDIKTLIIVDFAIAIINAGTIAIIWRQYKNHFAGLSLWFVSMALQVIGLALMIMRREVTDIVSVVLANFFLITSVVIFLIGLERFVGKKSRQIHNFILLAIFICFIVYYNVFNPNLTMRKILWSGMVAIFYSQGWWLLLRRVTPSLRRMTRITCMILGCYVAVSLVRIMLLVIFPLQTLNFFKSGIADSLSVTLYIMLGICLAISLILMVSKRLFEEVQAQERKFTTAFHSSPYAILLTRLSDGTIIEVNDGFVKIIGYQYDEVIGKTMLNMDIWHNPEDRTTIITELIKGNEVYGIEFPFRKKSGDIITGLFSASIIMIDNEQCILSSISDITELSQIKQRLQILATHDALTGLPNRTLLYEWFNIALTNARSKNTKLAIMSLDFDNFKPINDILGHDTGDKVLIAAATRLKELLRESDIIARFGGDEFVLLFVGTHKEEISEFVQNIIRIFRNPLNIEGRKIDLHASVGVAIYPEDGEDINELIKKSDKALYYVKNNGRDDYRFFSDLSNQGSIN